jgi:hypothetical protein
MKLWRRSSGHPEISKKNFKVVSGLSRCKLAGSLGFIHTQTRHRWITNDCNLTREPCISSLQSNNISTRPLYNILYTSHSSSNRFTHVKRGNTHVLNVESRRQPYGPHPHTNQNIKVSTLYTTHSSDFSKQMVWYQVRLCFKSGFGVVSVCGHPSRHTHTNPSPLNHKRL